MYDFTYRLKAIKFIHFFKCVFYCFLFFIGPLLFGQTVGTIQIGSGLNTSSGESGLPVTNYDYSYTQQIVSATEYAAAGGDLGNITKLRYKPVSVGNVEVWNNFQVYIANTTKTEFISGTDWVPFSELTLVFDGVVTPVPVDGEWFEITFLSPFVYTGDNIVIAVHENAIGWQGDHSFSSYESTVNSGIIWVQDDVNIDLAIDSPTAQKRTSNLAQIQFVCNLVDCAPPTDLVVIPTSDGGVITWVLSANGVSVDWKVVANNAGVDAVALQSGTVFSTTTTITGLEGNTHYDLYIKTTCSEVDDTNQWSIKIDFITLCGVVNTLSENFDNVALGELPTCWTFLGGDPLDFLAGFGYVVAQNAASQPNCFLIHNYFDNSSDYLLVSPETNNLGNGTKQLRFLAVADHVGTELIVGTMSDPAQISTFTPLSDGVLQLTDTYQEYVIPLPLGTDEYFAFKHGNVEAFEPIFIDDVLMIDPPACNGILYNTGVATEITDVQATLSWIGEAVNFDIEYGEVGFVLGSGTLLTNVSNNYVLTDLDEYTTYSFYVRSVCGVDEVSVWAGPFTFVTQKITTSPWFEGFSSGANDGWGNVSSNLFYLSNSISALIPYSDNVLYNSLYSAAGNGSGVTTLNIGPVSIDDKLTFDYRMALYYSPYGPVNASAGSIDVFISTDFGFNYTLLANLPYNEVDGWQNFEMPLDSYVGQLVKIKIVMNYNYDPNEYEAHYIGFDNFYIGSCDLPSIPSVVDTTLDSALINWDALPTDSFEIEYGLVDFIPGTGTIVSVVGNSTVLEGLIEASNYEFYIRKKCGTNYSSWLGKFKFSTTCYVFTAGFAENFDSTDSGNSINTTVPLCWSFFDGGAGYGSVVEGGASSSANSFYMYNAVDVTNDYILVSPETQNLNDGTYRVRFKASGGGNNYKLKFGTMSNKLDPTTFTQLEEFNLSYDFQEFLVYLPVGTNDFFAFKHGQSGTYQSIYIDDVVYEPNPTCAEPISLAASINLVDLTANLSWSGPETTTSNNFEIEWGEEGFIQGAGTVVTSTSYSTMLSNLIAGESYSFYVRRICSGVIPIWVGPFTFEMGYCVPMQPGFYDVDNLGVTNIVIGDLNVSPTPVFYTSYLNEALSLDGSELITSSVSLDTNAGFGSYSYDMHIWVDLNNDGIFDNNVEKVFTGVSLAESPTTLNTSFMIPSNGNYLTGEYRIRIAAADTAQSIPNPCKESSYSHIFDFKALITFPCIQPSDVNFVDVGFDYVTLDWQGQGDSGYELEYGASGFVQGAGAIVQNVTKPYTLNNLMSGTTYDFYIRKKCGNVYGDWSAVATTYIFCSTLEPTGANSQTLIQDELLSDLVIVGQNLKFYTDPELTIELPASTALESSGTFFVTQTINCESDAYLIVDVVVIPRIQEPIVNPIQNFCDGGTLGDIVVESLPGATVIWYENATGAVSVPLTTILSTGIYYVEQTDGVTTSHRVEVVVTVNPTPVDLVSQDIHLCGTSTFSNLVINNLPGTTVKWYSSLTDDTPINGNVPVSTGTYYVTQAFGVCESQRIAYQVSQFDALDKPLASAQVFCGSGTVSELVAEGVSGAQLMWYSSSNSATVLSPSAALSTGTYYVSQAINGCFSERRAVAVRVISIAAPQVSSFTICGGGEISDLYISAGSDQTFRWFISPSSTDELPQNTPLVQGVYFVERVQFDCVSARTPVQVTIVTVPDSPSGDAIQTFIEGSVIANLVLNQSNVVWYVSYTDSQNGVNPLSLNMPLVNGATYYAVVIGTNGCPSLPFAITVSVFLSSDEFVKEGLKYYPNPVYDLLSIDYIESIKNVEVFDLLGKRVKTLRTNNKNIQIDLSDLASGTYLVQLKTDSKIQFIKIIKK